MIGSPEKPLFLLLHALKLCESMLLEALLVEPFYFTPFSRKWLQTAPKAAGEAVSNGALQY